MGDDGRERVVNMTKEATKVDPKKELEAVIKGAELDLERRKKDLPTLEKACKGKKGLGHKYAVKRYEREKGLITKQLPAKIAKAKKFLAKMKG